jgi:fused signal recognition particle receptor
VLLVLDATTGQNGLAQARAFAQAVPLSGVILAKLDTSARGGVGLAISEAMGLPIWYVGVGEQEGDLLPFEPAAFVDGLLPAA